MRRIILGVALTGIATSIALAVRSQISQDQTDTGTAVVSAQTPVTHPIAREAATNSPVAEELAAQDTPPKPKPNAQPATEQVKPVRAPHPPIVENAENFQVPSVPAILTKASSAYRAVQTMRANFVQKRQNPLLGTNMVSRGTMYQKRPDRFLMKFTEPAGDIIVSDGRYFWVYYPSADRRQVLRAPASEAGSGGVDLQSQFLGDPVKRFTSTFNGIETVSGRSAYVLTMVPRGNPGYKSLKVWIDTKDSLARRFILTENNGVVQDFTLSNLTLNPTLSNDIFRFTPPADAHIVERP